MNPHPLDYHQILAQITLEHPNGGIDLQKEVARRFMAEGDAPATLPVQQQNADPGAPAGDAGQQAVANLQPMPETQQEQTDQALDKVIDQQGLKPQTREGIVTPLNSEATVSKPPAQAPRGTGGRGGLGDRQADFKQGQESIRQQADVTGQEGRAKSDLENQTARMQQGQVDDNLRYQSQLEAQKQHALARQMALIEQSAGTIDPKKYWGGLDGFHSVTARISMVLGALGGGLQGQGNTSPIVSQIQQNIAMQRDQFERDAKAANAFGDIYRNLTADGLSHAQATEATTKMMEAISARQIEGMAARFAGPMAQAKVGQDLANYGMDSRKKDAEAMASLSQAHNSNMEAKMKAFQLDQMKKQSDYWSGQGLPPGSSASNIVKDENGNTGYAANEKVLPDYDKVMMPVRGGISALKNIEAARSKGTAFHQAALGTYGSQLGLSLAQLAGEHESQRNKEIIDALKGNPKDITPIWWDQHRDAIQNMLTQTARNAEDTYQVNYNRPHSARPD